MLFVRIVAVDNIVAFIKLCEQLAKLRRMCLHVIVHGYDDVAGSISETGHYCIVLSGIARKLDRGNISVLVRKGSEHIDRFSAVRRAVIYKDEFKIIDTQASEFFSSQFNYISDSV